MDARSPKFRWGQPVKAAQDLYNDGSYPQRPADALLAHAGDAGEVVQVGTHTESGLPVYLVEFRKRDVIGCLEEEILPLGPG